MTLCTWGAFPPTAQPAPGHVSSWRLKTRKVWQEIRSWLDRESHGHQPGGQGTLPFARHLELRLQGWLWKGPGGCRPEALQCSAQCSSQCWCLSGGLVRAARTPHPSEVPLGRPGARPQSLLSAQVFGLGNKTYEHFNAMGKYVDQRLEQLGAQRIFELGLGDDDGK